MNMGHVDIHGLTCPSAKGGINGLSLGAELSSWLPVSEMEIAFHGEDLDNFQISGGS
jgi:hypothetical protein